MPFTSRRQQRAAFGGHIPGFSKQRAKEWAAETDFSKLPDRAPTEKGKPTLRKTAAAAPRVVYIAKQLREQLAAPGTSKNIYDAARIEQERHKRAFIEFCTKLAFALPAPGKIMTQARHVGGFSGQVTQNFLKPKGPVTTGVTNPRLSLSAAMTKSTRV